jgi:hypothetical protein
MPVLLGPFKMDVIVNVSFLTALGYALYFIGLEVKLLRVLFLYIRGDIEADEMCLLA